MLTENSTICITDRMSGIGQRVRDARLELGWSYKKLAAEAGIRAWQTVQDLESGASKSTKHVVGLAKALKVTPDWLETGQGVKRVAPATSAAPAKSQEELTSPEINIQQWRKDIPILGGAACGEDAMFELNGQETGTVRRPPLLVGAKDIYALYVYGDSMSPWREPGSLVYVNPNQPPKIGDYVVVEMLPEDQGDNVRKAYIKRLVRRTADWVVLEQFTPAEQKKLPAKRVRAVHRIIDWAELLGF